MSKGGYTGSNLSANGFYKEFTEELYALKHQNIPDFKWICGWFAPHSAWEDFVGLEGIKIGNRIYQRASRWNKANYS